MHMCCVRVCMCMWVEGLGPAVAVTDRTQRGPIRHLGLREMETPGTLHDSQSLSQTFRTEMCRLRGLSVPLHLMETLESLPLATTEWLGPQGQ